MQNKGFVRLFSVLLALVCIFYLSFTGVTNYYSDKAEEILKQEGNDAYAEYMDSISREKVWFGYTLKQCREKEINLGLDLKGGMNVILEVSVADILEVLSDHNTSPIFKQALQQAKERQLRSQENFLTLFKEEFEKIDPNAQLSTIFSTFNLKDKIQLTTSNEDVIKALNEEVEAAIENSFNVIRNRIDRFGVVQPNIQRLGDAQGRIMVELPGIKEPERVRKLLQGSANLEFWETYELSELMPMFINANGLIKSMTVSEEEQIEETQKVAEVEPIEAEDSTDSLDIDELLSDTLTNVEEEKTDEELYAEFKKENPLFAVLSIYSDGGQVRPGPAVGAALATDTAKVNSYLQMKQVKDLFPRDLSLKWTVKSIADENSAEVFELVAIKVTNREGRAPLEGDVITDANADFDQYSSASKVNMRMNAEGSKVWARLTKENIGKSIAIVLDDYVYSYPRVNGEITGGSSEISGQFSQTEAKDLANVLKSGKMPAPARIVQEDVVGPSLGQTAINDGMISFLIAFVLVLIYMILAYGVLPGLVVDLALVINVFFLMGILASFQAVLTLPGIAGIVLTLGMAVDANVLIFERIKEEVAAGKNLKKAVADGYKNAYSAIIDSNVTTLLTGVILFVFGTGPIKGFATTLIIGIITSLFTSTLITRLIFDRICSREKMPDLKFTTIITKKLLKNINFDFIKARKFGYVLSGSLILLMVISLSTRGLKQGIDFSGGRNYVIRFEQPVDIEELRETLSNVFTKSQVSVITMGDDNQVRFSTNYLINSIDENVDEQIETMLFDALKSSNKLAPEITKQMFLERYSVNEEGQYVLADAEGEDNFGVQSSQKVGPTIANDIKVSAIWAVLFSMIVIGLYILIRFRNLSFSFGAVVALIHDTLIILGIYSLFYSIMPFSLEIDQTFIAAILTVVGYSINDTVVIFDRIRENFGLYKRDRKELINMSLNTTLVRTFSTSLSTGIVVLAMFIFGGETIRGFLFAMLVGIIVGVYSTLFVAVPLTYDIQTRKEKKALKSK